MTLPGPFGGEVLLAMLAAAGVGFTLLSMGEGVASMEGQHWIMLAVFFVAGYVVARLWTQPAQWFGLP